MAAAASAVLTAGLAAETAALSPNTPSCKAVFHATAPDLRIVDSQFLSK